MFDTHTHLNFKAFYKNLDQVISDAKNAGINNFLIPGTDLETSQKAVEIARQYDHVWAAVGIHPHHAKEFRIKNYELRIKEFENLLKNNKVLAVGEVGLDKHVYQETKYENYHVDQDFIDTQKELLIWQIKLAVKHNKSLILHNREAVEEILEILEILENHWNNALSGRTVFHCCEPDERLLTFAKEHKIYLGVDGDITCSKKKQAFIKKIPLDFLVLETDSPFLLPEPLKSAKKYPNEPKNLKIIAAFIADILEMKTEDLAKITTKNALRLFNLKF